MLSQLPGRLFPSQTLVDRKVSSLGVPGGQGGGFQNRKEKWKKGIKIMEPTPEGVGRGNLEIRTPTGVAVGKTLLPLRNS